MINWIYFIIEISVDQCSHNWDWDERRPVAAALVGVHAPSMTSLVMIHDTISREIWFVVFHTCFDAIFCLLQTRRYVHQCYQANLIIKIKQIRDMFNESDEGEYSAATVHRIMRDFRYRYNKNNYRPQIFERTDIVEQRWQFCSTLAELRLLGNSRNLSSMLRVCRSPLLYIHFRYTKYVIDEAVKE